MSQKPYVNTLNVISATVNLLMANVPKIMHRGLYCLKNYIRTVLEAMTMLYRQLFHYICRVRKLPRGCGSTSSSPVHGLQSTDFHFSVKICFKFHACAKFRILRHLTPSSIVTNSYTAFTTLFRVTHVL